MPTEAAVRSVDGGVLSCAAMRRTRSSESRRTALMFVIALSLVAPAALTPAIASACSQCMCGTPFPADVLGGVVPSRLTFGLEDRYLSKRNALDEGPGHEEEREHRIGAFALWRPMNRLSLLARIP